MKRREFIALLGGGAAVGPLAALGQQPTPLIGLLHSARAANFGRFIDAFHGGLKENGFIEGQTIAIEQRWAEGQYDRLPALAADLVTRRVVLIATMGGEAPALAAKNATSTIPIVFVPAAIR
jgi:putative ABC transport system substrate-binding protein